MANTTDIRIIIDERFNLDYEDAESLNIKFNRVVEDFTDLSKRFGEFSYTFSLPKTKTNVMAFDYATVKGKRRLFEGTQKPCRVYNKSRLLLDGVVELRSVTTNTLELAFYSKFTQLLDDLKGLNGREKSLKDIISLGNIEDFNYESSIRAHINSQFTEASTDYQFPFAFYSTMWTPNSILSTTGSDFNGNTFDIPDNFLQNYYYIISSNSLSNINQFYFHQFPIGLYLLPVFEAMLRDAGWTLGGQFFKRPEIAKIMIMYAGDNDIYDQAIGCPEDTLDACTGVTNNLWLPTFLPDIKQTDFLKGLMNMFNLYFTVDTQNRIINFETWSTLFEATIDPYDITDKVFLDTVNFKRIDNYDPTIRFEDQENMRVLGDNKVLMSNETNAKDCDLEDTEDLYADLVFNKIGSTSEIQLPFGAPTIARKYLRQEVTFGDTDIGKNDLVIFLPQLTSQTPQDNDNKPFYKSTGDTFVQNDESTIKYKGTPCLMWYYGQSNSNIKQVGSINNDQFMYQRIGSAATKSKITFANPFTLLQGFALDQINSYLSGSTKIAKSKTTAEISYLKGLHYNIGRVNGDVDNVPPYSLTFGDDDTYHKTLYTEFHRKKYNLFSQSEMMEAEMRMNEVDWNEMQINRTIEYDDEYYIISAIREYDIVQGRAKIELIKKL